MRARGTSFGLSILVILSIFSIGLTILPENARAATLYVGGIGPGNFTTIQSAIDAANPGDQVFVFNGSFHENVIVNKTLSLFGEDKNTTIVDGDQAGSVFNVTANWVNITGFTATNSSGSVWDDPDAGIKLHYVQNCRIDDNNVSSNNHGIYLVSSSYTSITSNNVSWNDWTGIHLNNSNNNTLTDNIAFEDRTAGIGLDSSNGNIIVRNHLLSQMQNGIWLYYSNDNTLTDNDAFYNWDSGIWLDFSDRNLLSSGNFSLNHGLGIELTDSDNNMIINYTLLNNSDGGIWLEYSNNNTIEGNNATGNLYDGISVWRSNGNLISSNMVISNDWDGIYLDESYFNVVVNNVAVSNGVDGVSSYFTENSTIVNNRIISNWYDAIYLADSAYATVTNNTMTEGGVFIDSPFLQDWNTHVIDTNNTVNGKPLIYWKNRNGGTVPMGAGEVILANCTGVTVLNQDLTNGSAGIQLGFSSGNTLTDNNLSGNHNALTFWRSDNNSILNNTAHKTRYDGFDIWRSVNNTIARNKVTYSGDFGIILADSGSSTIANNSVSNNTIVGIYLAGSQNNVVTNNSVSDNTFAGIILDGCDDSIISNNNVSGQERGIYSGSDNAVIAYNNVSNNDYGIYWRSSDGGLIAANTLTSNSVYGIYLQFAFNNKIYHNWIIDNGNQSYDDGTNSWDNGYPSGGNYWSDYSGVDFKNGPNQDQAGSDGIGDTRYSILGGTNEDRYPLMDPTYPSPYPPWPPGNLQASAGDGQVRLTWEIPLNDGGSNITNYTIYRGPTPGAETFLTEPGTVLIYNDTGLNNGWTYYYFVRAKSAIGEGAESNVASATPTTGPGAPSVLKTVLSGSNLEDVTVTWSLSSDDGSGQISVIRYTIHRNVTHDVNGTGYNLIAQVPNGVTEYVDSLAGEGNPNNYFYQVCAVDLNYRTNCSQNQGGKFTRPLLEGVNIASFPLIQSDMSLGGVLQTVEWDKTWMYNSSVKKWDKNTKVKPYAGELETLSLTRGFWVNVTRSSNLTVAGVVPFATTIQLIAGWNLVGFPSFNTTYTVGDLKSKTGATGVEGYDPTPPYFLKALQDSDVLQAGQGYWVYVTSDVIWQVQQ